MHEPYHDWRALLAHLTRDPKTRQGVAEKLGVNPLTILRWTRGESQPRIQSLYALPDVFPSHRDQFVAFIEEELQQILPMKPKEAPVLTLPELPVEYLIKILSEYARAEGPFAAWYQRNMALQHLCLLLGNEGITISLIRCVPPQGSFVRSLCEIMGVGTAPWKPGTEQRLCFLGAESFSGYVVEKGEPAVVQDLQRPGVYPFRCDGYEGSAAAFPLQRRGKVAGCLLAASILQDAWNADRLYFLEAYSYAVALSFEDQDFYPHACIHLHEISLNEERDRMLQQSFKERVRQLRSKSLAPLTVAQAEILILQQIETELLEEEKSEDATY